MAEGGWNDCRRPGNGKWFVWNEGSISLFAFPYPSQPSTVLSLFLHIPSLFPHLPHTTPHTTSPCRLLRHIPFHAPCPPRSCLRSNSSLAFVSSSQVMSMYHDDISFTCVYMCQLDTDTNVTPTPTDRLQQSDVITPHMMLNKGAQRSPRDSCCSWDLLWGLETASLAPC